MDTALFFALYGDGHGALAWVMIALSFAGSGWTALGVAPFVAMKRTRRHALMLALAFGVTALTVFGLKAAIGRARPCACLPGVHAVFFDAPTDPSFPSGHAAGSFCLAAFFIVLAAKSSLPLRVRAVAQTALLAIASGIALSRVYLGVHYPLDIAAGAALGSIIGTLFALRARAGSIQTAPRG